MPSSLEMQISPSLYKVCWNISTFFLSHFFISSHLIKITILRSSWSCRSSGLNPRKSLCVSHWFHWKSLHYGRLARRGQPWTSVKIQFLFSWCLLAAQSSEPCFGTFWSRVTLKEVCFGELSCSFLFFFFLLHLWYIQVLEPGTKPVPEQWPKPCSDNSRSLTCCTTKKML